MSRFDDFKLWFVRTFFSDARSQELARKMAWKLDSKPEFLALSNDLMGTGIVDRKHLMYGVAHYYERHFQVFKTYAFWAGGSYGSSGFVVSGRHDYDPRYLALGLYLLEKTGDYIPVTDLIRYGIELDNSGDFFPDKDWGDTEPDAPSEVMYWRHVYGAIHAEPALADYINAGMRLAEARKFHSAGIDAQLALSLL